MQNTQSRIQILSPQLANQIAAGEVIERPASVVKELLENSLDAGANIIEVDVEQGGLRLIRVRDNGYGIEKADLALALHRHATSKIQTLSDLEAVQSLGFRGEALASIASVSRFSLTSQVAGQETAWQITGEGSAAQNDLKPAAHPIGTTVEVRDLFFNTPARRKFMRSETTEFNHIEEVIKRLALSRMDLALILRHNQKVIHRLQPANNEAQQAERIARIFGKIFLEESIYFDTSRVNLRLWGWLGSPNTIRHQGDLQYTYINGRMVRDKVFNHAIRLAYENKLPPTAQACYVLYLECLPQDVDVNAHPTKHEVRFRESRLIHDFILHTVLQALGAPITQPILPRDSDRMTRKEWQAVQHYHQAAMPLFPEVREAETVTYQTTLAEVKTPALGHALAQAHERYLVAENKQGVIIVDIEQAQDWLYLQRLRKAFEEGKVITQPLLVPQRIKLTPELIKRLDTCQNLLKRLGFILENSGPDQALIRQAPTFLIDADLSALCSQILQNIKQDSDVILQTMAKASAKKARYSLSELNTLLRDLEQWQGEQQSFIKWHPLFRLKVTT